ncbi:fungal-specific transcription factor domain-containing protein [Aspergillus crustosus]
MSTTEKTSSRQQPGSACEDCRQRKLRCDRQKPECGSCLELGIRCQFRPTLPPRGPKKGYVLALRAKITDLEAQLLEQQIGARRSQETLLEDTGSRENGILPMQGLILPGRDPMYGGQTTPPLSSITSTRGSSSVASSPPNNSLQWQRSMLSEDIRADLDQLYFDRVHLFCPMLHRRRYLSWSNEPCINKARVCLQHAMWTMAAALCSTVQNMRDLLYAETKQMMAALESDETAMRTLQIEHIQAGLLLCIYEFMRDMQQRALMRMGQVFRMVQLMRLHTVDSPSCIVDDTDEMEERRRTFWVSYFLDGFVSMNNGLPLTLNEQEIYTRLPMPEVNFQNRQPALKGFLSELMAGLNDGDDSPLTECIVVATICGRSLRHKQRLTMEQIYGDVSEDFWDQHRWLTAILMTHIQTQVFTPNLCDPMRIFVNQMAQTVVFFLEQIVALIPADGDKYFTVKRESEQLSMAAAKDVTDLVKELLQLNRFQIHPLMSIPLGLSMQFFQMRNETYALQLQEISDTMINLKSISLFT